MTFRHVCVEHIEEDRSGYNVLLHVVNSSITHSETPSAWKHNLVHPIYKSSDAADPSNFRPIYCMYISMYMIYILLAIAKVVEKLVQHQLHHYLTSNHLLSPTQYGFRHRHSTETALIDISHRVFGYGSRSNLT